MFDVLRFLEILELLHTFGKFPGNFRITETFNIANAVNSIQCKDCQPPPATTKSHYAGIKQICLVSKFIGTLSVTFLQCYEIPR